MKRGLSGKESMYIYGYSVGMAMPLMYVPLTFVGSMAFVMLPTLSSAVAAKTRVPSNCNWNVLYPQQSFWAQSLFRLLSL